MLVTRPLVRVASILVTVLLAPSLAADEVAVGTRTGSLTAVRRLAESGYSPAERVRKALDRAANGDISHWHQYLTDAIESDADFAPARWHAGYLRDGDRWVTIDEANRKARQDELLAEYRKMRDVCSETVEGQLRLARWCLNNGLKDEERAHLAQVLLKEPKNAAAHRALGDRLIRGVWISAEELHQAKEQQQRLRESTLRWTSYLDQARVRLVDEDPKHREAGRERLRAITAPDAIPAMERVLSRRGAALAKEVLSVLKTMGDPEATLSIVRHALYSPWNDVRAAAAVLLKDRPFDHYVPLLISTLRGSIESQYTVTRKPDGRLLYEHILFREGPEANERVIFESFYTRQGSGESDGQVATQQALDEISQGIAVRQQMVAVQNNDSDAMNERIVAVLSAATEADLGADPNHWWQWWANHNGVYYKRDKKPVNTQRYTALRSIADPSPPSERMECLVAGTTVWTNVGPVSIEKIRPGDRVLAQDPETGELAHKPVLRTTVRALVTITVDGETFTASEGHAFWVNGTGWAIARAIKEDSLLYGVPSAHRVQAAVANLDEEPTYNLVVADFHTYFIGDSRVLVHDNSVRKPTNAKVPGHR